MLKTLAKRLAARLPVANQQELKRIHFRREIGHGTFRTDEPEWDEADRWLTAGDWAIDVGANVGHYTKRFSDLVGPGGRVISFEPVPATFELLSANVARFRNSNVTLLNIAASDETKIVTMRIPRSDSGLRNYYQAAICDDHSGLQVLAYAIDAMGLPAELVRLIKIDAEGHDAFVLGGANRLLAHAKPVVVIESVSSEVYENMKRLGYSMRRSPGSPNMIFEAL